MPVASPLCENVLTANTPSASDFWTFFLFQARRLSRWRRRQRPRWLRRTVGMRLQLLTLTSRATSCQTQTWLATS